MKTLSSSLAVALGLTMLLGCSSETGGRGGGSGGPVELPGQEVVPPAPDQPAGTGGAPAAGATPATPGGAAPEPQYKLPVWQREDVQPRSARFKQTYGLETFGGKTIVVVLLEGFCPFCRSNSVVAQQLQDALTAEKLDVQIVVLGDANATEFASRVSLPIFKDGDGEAWNSMRNGASKHDTFVFGPTGLRTYFWLGSYQGDATRWTKDVGEAVRKVAKPL